MAEPVALAAIAIEVAIGWPARLYGAIGHPVGGFARVIGTVERFWNRPERSPAARWSGGVVLMLGLGAGTAGLCIALESAMQRVLGDAAWIGIALLAWPGMAMRSLYDHVRPVSAALTGGDLPAARDAVAMIVGRDTAALDEAGVARAGIESLAESACDGVVAPLFWLMLLGLPGLWTYKAINTADSLIGHREDRWRAFGWAAARADDLANLLPARITGAVLCLAGGGGWRVMWRDCRRHASPNAGWPEAAMAGALGVALAGPIAYDGVMQDKPWIGHGGDRAGAGDVDRALSIYRRACVVIAIVAGSVAWLR